jgi:hypothetical protein
MATTDKTIKEAVIGDATLRLIRRGTGFAGAIFRNGKMAKAFAGEVADHVWTQMQDEVAISDPRYFGFDGAKKRFLRLMPGGFQDAAYRNKERTYKDQARAWLAQNAPVELASIGRGFSEAILSVYRQTNLLHPVEKSKIQSILRSEHEDAFVQAAAQFALKPGQGPLLDMQKILATEGVANWTAATYLPFLWRPETQMFLKPEVTRDFAVRVGHRFDNDYEATLNFPVYESLLDLTAKTAEAIADLKPADRIDVQSFIWVVGRYRNDDTESSAS